MTDYLYTVLIKLHFSQSIISLLSLLIGEYCNTFVSRPPFHAVFLCCFSKVLDPEWMTGLTPMTRLFMTAGLASTGAEIHFVDTHRASFELPEHATHSPSTERGVKKSLTSPGQPRPGQVGVLRFGDPGIGEEFVMSTHQPLPDRLTVSAGSSPSHSRVGMGRGRGTEGGLRGDQASVQSNHGATMDEQEARPVCVKYLGTVGMQGVHREDWFPTKDDALSMRVAIDAYCPISWLRDGGRNRQMSAGERRYGQRRRTEESRNRRLLIYQRDKNRVVVEVEKVRFSLVLTNDTKSCFGCFYSPLLSPGHRAAKIPLITSVLCLVVFPGMIAHHNQGLTFERRRVGCRSRYHFPSFFPPFP